LPVEDHRELWKDIKVKFCLLVTSDAVVSGVRADEVTPLVKSLVAGGGHELIASRAVSNNPAEIELAIKDFLRECDVILVSGGTGVSRRDVSADVVTGFCSKLLPGFGELFRYLTYMQYGSAAIMSRSYACTSGNSVIFALPGSPQAVELALTKLILPEIKHLIGELRK